MLSEGGVSHGLQPWGWIQRKDSTACPPALISLSFLTVWLSRVAVVTTALRWQVPLRYVPK